MHKKYKYLLLASAIIGMASLGTARAQTTAPNTKDGFYITPNAELIFIDKNFTRGLSNKPIVGGGGGLALGYKIKNLSIDFNIDYQAFSTKGMTDGATSPDGTRWLNGDIAGDAFLQGYNTAIQQGKSNDDAINAGEEAVAASFPNNPGPHSLAEMKEAQEERVGTNLKSAYTHNLPEMVISSIEEQRAMIENGQDAATVGVRNARRGAVTQRDRRKYQDVALVDITTGVSTNITNHESFIPVTLGLKYAFAIAPKNMFSITPGLAAGVWIHTVRRALNTTFTPVYGATPFAQSSTDNVTQVRGVIVPSLSLDYNPLPDLTVSLAGKFYLVPNGYSDNYSAVQQATQAIAATTDKSGYRMSDPQDNAYFDNNTLPLGLDSARNATNKFMWYGGLNLAVQYIF
ncbi:MAG: hypothetical protein QM529_04195 [Hydrotalea sp.]|nr:hypothetical protein [Hydrotalea sp.]